MTVLTDEFIRQTTCDSHAPIFIRDSHKLAPVGFGVRISKRAKTFVLRYMIRGKGVNFTIGRYPAWTLAAARKEAALLRADIDRGIDIQAVKRSSAPPRGEEASLDESMGSPTGGGEAQGITVSKALDLYKESRLDGLKSGKQLYASLVKYLVEVKLDGTKFGDKLVADVRRGEVIRIIEPVAKTVPRRASVVLTYTKAIFEWCEDREYITTNPIATLRPAKINKAMVGKKRDRVLDHDEIRSFWSNVETCGMSRVTALALKMILVSGQRPGEVAGMSEREIHNRVWDIPGERRKREIPHSIYLADMAWDIVESAKAEVDRLSRRRKGKRGGYTFEARAGSPITTGALREAVTRFKKELKIKTRKKKWSPHDLRRTCRTGLAACGVPKDIAEIVIGHTLKGVVAVYDRHQYANEIRIALYRWERYLTLILNSKSGSDLLVKLDTSWAEDLIKG